MEHIRPNWQSINHVQPGSVQTMLKTHKAVFQGGLDATRPEFCWTQMLHLTLERLALSLVLIENWSTKT